MLSTPPPAQAPSEARQPDTDYPGKSHEHENAKTCPVRATHFGRRRLKTGKREIRPGRYEEANWPIRSADQVRQRIPTQEGDYNRTDVPRWTTPQRVDHVHSGVGHHDQGGRSFNQSRRAQPEGRSECRGRVRPGGGRDRRALEGVHHHRASGGRSNQLAVGVEAARYELEADVIGQIEHADAEGRHPEIQGRAADRPQAGYERRRWRDRRRSAQVGKGSPGQAVKLGW